MLIYTVCTYRAAQGITEAKNGLVDTHMSKNPYSVLGYM